MTHPGNPRAAMRWHWRSTVGRLGVCMQVLVFGCARKEPPTSARELPQAAKASPGDSALPPAAWPEARLARIKSAHHLADLAATPEAKAEAAQALHQVFVDTDTKTDDLSVVVRQDLAARASALWFSAGRADEALADAQAGLALSPAPSVLRAQLLVCSADVYQQRNQQPEAAAALMEALRINQQLLERELQSP